LHPVTVRAHGLVIYSEMPGEKTFSKVASVPLSSCLIRREKEGVGR